MSRCKRSMIIVIDEPDIASDQKNQKTCSLHGKRFRRVFSASSRKLVREQKKGMKGEGKRRKGNLVFLLSVPSQTIPPSPFIFVSDFRAVLNSIGNDRRSGSKIKKTFKNCIACLRKRYTLQVLPTRKSETPFQIFCFPLKFSTGTIRKHVIHLLFNWNFRKLFVNSEPLL